MSYKKGVLESVCGHVKITKSCNHCSLWVPFGKRVVGGVATSDLTGLSSSILIEIDYSGIFHCSEDGDVKQVARISITTSCVCDLLSHLISPTILFIILALFYLFIFYYCKIICFDSNTSRKQLRTSTLI